MTAGEPPEREGRRRSNSPQNLSGTFTAVIRRLWKVRTSSCAQGASHKLVKLSGIDDRAGRPSTRYLARDDHKGPPVNTSNDVILLRRFQVCCNDSLSCANFPARTRLHVCAQREPSATAVGEPPKCCRSARPARRPGSRREVLDLNHADAFERRTPHCDMNLPLGGKAPAFRIRGLS